MFVTFTTAASDIWAFRFPNTFQINANDASHLDISDSDAGGTEQTITLSDTATTIDWTGD